MDQMGGWVHARWSASSVRTICECEFQVWFAFTKTEERNCKQKSYAQNALQLLVRLFGAYKDYTLCITELWLIIFMLVLILDGVKDHMGKQRTLNNLILHAFL